MPFNRLYHSCTTRKQTCVLSGYLQESGLRLTKNILGDIMKWIDFVLGSIIIGALILFGINLRESIYKNRFK